MITVDGVTYNNLHVISLKRSFSVLDGPNAGRALDGVMIRDIIGTYYNYTLEIDPDMSDPAEYDSFYQIMSAPAASHTVIFPYGQTTLTFTAYVANGDDELATSYDGLNRWGGLSINFVAMAPQRRPT